MASFRQLLTAFRALGEPEPGLYQRDDDSVWYRAADGSDHQVGVGGGSQPAWEAVTVPTDAPSWTALDSPGTCLADSAPALPLTIDGTNDTFQIVGNPPALATEDFVVPHGVYATIGALVAAMAAAIGSGSGERFDTRITPTVSTTKILLTTGPQGGLDSGIQEGNGGAAALGFTFNPNGFNDGYGGDWTFSMGVITSPVTGSTLVATTTDEWGQAWAVEVEVSVPNPAAFGGITFNANASIVAALIPSLQEDDGSGFEWINTGTPSLRSAIYNSVNELAQPAIADTDFHTIRMVNLPLVQLAYYDGVLVGQNHSTPNQVDASSGPTSRFLLFDAGSLSSTGGTSFRNLKAWRIPMPTFP